jgi:hypothetical protein
MRFVAPVGDEIFGELVGVQHPGFYRGGGSWETNNWSQAYVYPPARKYYLAGGFQGGAKYYKFCLAIKKGIDKDIESGHIAVWHDESYWNHQPHRTRASPPRCLTPATNSAFRRIVDYSPHVIDKTAWKSK